ncbi:MAG: histidine phosphatase family protein [Ruminococcaceae bacterium]|nr:histidine phosphatase family protein [Oscillospiraceae bacterium]
MTTLYLIRHGESTSNVDKTFTGQLDAQLTELGRKQAGCIAGFFLGTHIDRIFASDLSRAYETALPLSKISRVPVVKHTAFREIYGGKWEGEKFAQLQDMYPEDYAIWRNDISNARPTGGESIREIARRTTEAAEAIVKEHPGETIVIASHAVPIRVMLSTWLTGGVEDMQGTSWLPNASISKVVYENGVFTPVEMGITEHLQDMITNLPDKI